MRQRNRGVLATLDVGAWELPVDGSMVDGCRIGWRHRHPAPTPHLRPTLDSISVQISVIYTP